MTRRVLLVVLALTLGACGSNDRGFSNSALDLFQRDVNAVKVAVAAGNRAAADHALANLRQHVGTLRNDHLVTDSAASRILAAAADVHNQLQLLAGPSTTTTTTTTTTTSTLPPTPPTQPNGHGRRKHGDGGD